MGEHDSLVNLRAARIDRRTFTIGAVVGAAAVTGGVVAARAQDATPAAGATAFTLPEGVEAQVLASGLNNPRYVKVIGDWIFFTEAGVGGEDALFATPVAGQQQDTGSAVTKRGHSGTLKSIGPDLTEYTIVNDFISYTFGAVEVVGASGLGFDGNGSAYVIVGAPGPYIGQIDRTGEEAAVYKVDLATGEKSVIADIGAYEIANNPDPMAIDSNPYGGTYADGLVYVADAGGNAIYTVNAESGELAVFAVTGGLAAPFLPDSGNPGRHGAKEIDSVPSTVTQGPNGNLFVTFVTGGPFPPGLAPVYEYAPDGTKTDFATGLTMSTDIAFSSDGTAYVCVMSSNLLAGGPGQIVRVGADGTKTVVLDGLMSPNGIAFDNEDNLFVTHKANGFPGAGELVRFSGVTAVAGTPFTLPAAQAPASPEAATPEAASTEAATPAVTEEATPAASPVASLPTTVAVTMIDIKFDPTELTIPADTDVIVNLTNTGALPHDFTIDELHVSSGIVPSGGKATIKINAPAGKYTYYCSQPGHRTAGMQGTLTVQ
ncbi:MAG: ScyD/ScyE family protein [Thermomicrobiales bacterium]